MIPNLFIFLVYAACMVAAWCLAPILEVNLKIAMLIALIIGYLLASGIAELFRYRLRKRVEQMSAKQLSVLSELYPEIRYSIPARGSASPRVTTLVGAVAINGMVLPLMIGPIALLQSVFDIHNPVASALALVLGFVLAWTWWSIGVTVWRWWATQRRGMPPDEVQWRGEKASLLWPRNHLLEKTELGNLLSRRRTP